MAETLGLVIGQLAREGHKDEPKYFLMQVPNGWTETHDEFGQYLVDTAHRRRIRFGNINRRFNTNAELLTRFCVQEWWLVTSWIVYVRKIVGRETNVYRYAECNHIAETEILIANSAHRGKERSPGFVHCEKWLQKHYPDWRNPLAYWGVP